MKIQYTVIAPISLTTNTGENGQQTQKEIVRLQPVNPKAVDGVQVRAGDLQIITTDPAKFGKYKVGQVVDFTAA